MERYLLKAQFALVAAKNTAADLIKPAFIAASTVAAYPATLALNQFVVEPNFLDHTNTPTAAAFLLYVATPLLIAPYYAFKGSRWFVNKVEGALTAEPSPHA